MQSETVSPNAANSVAAVVLAAGASSRMGSNKLLAELNGKPMIRHAVEAAIASRADPVIVVTGRDAKDLMAALQDLDIQFTDNPDYSKGLSTSLRTGINAIPSACGGALVMLGDMPGISPGLIDCMIAAFDGTDRAIIVATRNGQRGNPVLWARQFFPQIKEIQGDVGARNLINAYPHAVCEIEAGDDAPLIDIDTPQMLEAYRAR
jgi:molybdenum cofactor cytidylyltransferase